MPTREDIRQQVDQLLRQGTLSAASPSSSSATEQAMIHRMRQLIRQHESTSSSRTRAASPPAKSAERAEQLKLLANEAVKAERLRQALHLYNQVDRRPHSHP